jgi:hypothetical protein
MSGGHPHGVMRPARRSATIGPPVSTRRGHKADRALIQLFNIMMVVRIES